MPIRVKKLHHPIAARRVNLVGFYKGFSGHVVVTGLVFSKLPTPCFICRRRKFKHTHRFIPKPSPKPCDVMALAARTRRLIPTVPLVFIAVVATAVKRCVNVLLVTITHVLRRIFSK